jgi:nickel-dependent lactate racemase
LEVEILYGKQNKTVDFPEPNTVILDPKQVDVISNEEEAIRKSLKYPINSPAVRDLIGINDTVAIVFSDITRPVRNDLILPVLLEELNSLPDDRIVLINALGTHRKNTPEELTEILGSEITERYRVHQHDFQDQSNLLSLGMNSYDHEVWVNKVYLESTVRILTGLIEPHLFAGISGGPKSVLPGISGEKTIYGNHSTSMIGDPLVGFAQTDDNPIWEEMLEVALMTEPAFIVNLTQTEYQQLTGVFSGEMQKTHSAGLAFVKESAMVIIDQPFDIVVSTAGGYPLDISMYQSVKGIAVAGCMVKEGGDIVLVSECAEGLPAYGEYGEIMRLADSPDALLNMLHKPGFFMQDQWDAQIQAQICAHTGLHIYTDGLDDQEIQHVFGIPCHSIEDTLEALLVKHGPKARIGVLPAGPLTIPCLSDNDVG